MMLRWLLPIVLLSLAFAPPPPHPHPRLHRGGIAPLQEPDFRVPVVRR